MSSLSDGNDRLESALPTYDSFTRISVVMTWASLTAITRTWDIESTTKTHNIPPTLPLFH